MFDVGDLKSTDFRQLSTKGREWLSGSCNNTCIFYVLTSVSKSEIGFKKHDILRFFWVVAHVFSNTDVRDVALGVASDESPMVLVDFYQKCTNVIKREVVTMKKSYR